jgi:sulfonate transport system substrate-binding protein
MKKGKKIVSLMAALGLSLALTACGSSAASESKLKTIKLDYATYSPLSLVIKKMGWAEEEFQKDGVEVTWTLSQGSNKALEFLASKSVDFGSASGAASLISRSKDVPIQAIYSIAKPQGVALLAMDKNITKVEDIKGKKVAATFGTDPYIFLLSALKEAGLTIRDVEYVNLQHGDGYQALLKGDVDVWSGLDPITATAELESDAHIFYRNPAFIPNATLNVHEDFAKEHPEAVQKVIDLYERARKWVAEHPDEVATLIAEEAKISPEVAKIQLSRTDVSNPVLTDEHVESFANIGKILQEEKVIDPGVDILEVSKGFVNQTYTANIKQ